MKRHLLLIGLAAVSLIACANDTGDEQGELSNDLAINARVPVTVVRKSNQFRAPHSDAQLTALVRSKISLRGYREARVEEVQGADGTSRIVVQLLVDGKHALKLARIDLDGASNVEKITHDTERTPDEEV